MGVNVDEKLQRDAFKFAEALKRYPTSTQIGIGVVLPNIVNGCSWGFVGNNPEFEKNRKEIDENPNMGYYKIKNGYLVYMNFDYLIGILKQVLGGYFTREDLDLAVEHRKKALADIQKFMMKGGMGLIGVYNLNDSPKITIKGNSYPSFCVTLPDLLACCIKYSYGFKLGNQVRTPNQVSAHLGSVIGNLEVAPSGNALLIKLAPIGR